MERSIVIVKNAENKFTNNNEVLYNTKEEVAGQERYLPLDDIPSRFLRPHDARFDLYKKNLNIGLEIYLELDKDISNLPRNLQILFEFLRTGKAPADAPEYLKEAAEMMKKTNFTAEERKLADFYTRAHMKRVSEDEYVREEVRQEERTKANAEKIATIKRFLRMGLSNLDVAKGVGVDVDVVVKVSEEMSD